MAGYTCLSNGFLDCVIPVFIEVDARASKILVQGAGSHRAPYTLRYDLGRVLAETFRNPDQFKDKWITVVNNRTTLNTLAEIGKTQLPGNLEVENTAITDRAPILKLFEVVKIPLFDTLDDHASCPVGLTDMLKTMKWSVNDGKLTVDYE